ncbi:MAG: hypothetical protein ACFFEN_05040 [Candidatus Thorarchaeota archaeon]
MDTEEILNLCKLTKEEMKEYLRITNIINPKEDHKRAYRTMMNQTRRELLKFIGVNFKTFEEIMNKFQEGKEQMKYHLSMLEQLHYIMETKSGWKATPRGIGFLYNVVLRED